MCLCDIICHCLDNNDLQLDLPPNTTHSDTSHDGAGVAGLLGKTRPPASTYEEADKQLFNIKNDYTTYAYTLSPKQVGIMNNKNRELQYKTLKRLHTEVLSQFICSYMIFIEIYPSNDNDLHCHGMIRFRTHADKVKFKKLITEKITLGRKGTYKNLIDCEFVNSFDSWADYITKAQVYIISLGYLPIISINHMFHQSLKAPPQSILSLPVASKKRLKAKSKVLNEIEKLEFKLKTLKNTLENL